MTPDTYNEPPKVFGPSGRFIGNLGRSGDGPGEFRLPHAILVSPDDTVYVFDGQTGRLTVFSPAHDLVRTALVANRVYTAALLSDGTFIVNATLADRDRFGYPLHRFDANGNYLASFGDENPIVVPRYPRHIVRWISPSADDAVWSVPLNHRYVVEKWDRNGELQIALERDAEWFRPYERLELPTPDRSPMPRLMGVREDENGFVWTIAHVGDPKWTEGLAEGARVEGRMMYRITDQQKVYDCIIETIDPSTGTLVASQRFDETFDLFIEPNLIAAVREAEQGWQYVEIFEVRLETR